MQVTLDGDKLLVRLDAGSFDRLNAIRKLPYRKYDATRNAWVVDHVTENFEAAQTLGLPLGGVPAPTRSASSIGVKGKNLTVRVPPDPDNINLCRAFPDQRTWNKTDGAWVVKPTRRNVEHLKEYFPDVPFSDEARDLITKTEAPFVQDKRELDDLVERSTRDYKFGTSPYQHQLEAFALGRDAEAFAYFMEQGTGKTYVTVNNAGFLFGRGDINGVFVVCPKSVKSTWDEEIAEHLPAYIERHVLVWQSGKTTVDNIKALDTSGDKLTFFIMNIDAFSSGSGIGAAEAFLSRFTCMMAIDESSKIKNPQAKRTKAAIKIGALAKYRRVLTGTPVTQSPLDLFTQFKFLDENILGFGSYYAFRNHFTIMGGWQNKQVLKYVNMSELQDVVAPYSYRVTKDECLDLPPTVYRKLTVDMTPAQSRAYKEMQQEMTTTLSGHQVSTTLVLTQMLRLQQIVGGFLPVPADDIDPEDDVEAILTKMREARVEPLPGGNPKLDAMMEDLESEHGKVLIWCRFRAEIDLIAKRLRKDYGEEAVAEFHGGVTETDRTSVRLAFQEPTSPLRFLVLQVDTGGVGLTFTAAGAAYYFSNSFSLESRLQSEARNHRAGSEVHEHITYTDIVAKDTLDNKLLRVLRKKLSLANVITGDNWKEWI